MKYLAIILGLLSAAVTHATTVTLSSPPTGPAVFNNSNVSKVPDGSLVRVGMLPNPADPGSFVEFGTSIVRSAGAGSNIIAGKIIGIVRETQPESAHGVFNGKTIYIWVYDAPTASGATQSGIFRTSRVFPANDPLSIDDSVTIQSANEIVDVVSLPGVGYPQILPGDAVDSKHFVLGSSSIPPLDSDGDGLPDFWETSNGLNSNDSADAALDPDGDTIDNRLEHALGSDPLSRSSPGLPVQGKIQVGQTDYATFQFTRLKGLTGSTLIPEMSTSLFSSDWHSGASDLATVSVTDQGLNEVVILRDTQPLASRTRLYFRLRLTVP